MTSSTIANESRFSSDRDVWASLKQAIAKSSGFKSWQHQQIMDQEASDPNLDSQVRLYLRETLETLAY
jgi:hypothetical protein